MPKKKVRKDMFYHPKISSKKYWDIFTLLNPKCKNIYDRSINYYEYPERVSCGVPKPLYDYRLKDNRYIMEQFFIQTFRDELSPLSLLRAFIRGYIAGDKDLRCFVDRIRKEIKIQDDIARAREEGEEKEIEKREQIIDQFALGKKEIENVFDMLETDYDKLRGKR